MLTADAFVAFGRVDLDKRFMELRYSVVAVFPAVTGSLLRNRRSPWTSPFPGASPPDRQCNQQSEQDAHCMAPNSSGNFATFTAMRRASSKVSTFAMSACSRVSPLAAPHGALLLQ